MTPDQKRSLDRLIASVGLYAYANGPEMVEDVERVADALYAAEVARGRAQAEAAALREAVERAREAMRRSVSDCHDSHYAHHDPKGTAGANCPACIERRDDRQRLRDALAALPSAEAEADTKTKTRDDATKGQEP